MFPHLNSLAAELRELRIHFFQVLKSELFVDLFSRVSPGS